jgi:hypothetical protein
LTSPIVRSGVAGVGVGVGVGGVPEGVGVAVGVTVLKVAVTVVSALMVIWQDPVPVQAPLHPAKEDPAAGAAVRVTGVPEL